MTETEYCRIHGITTDGAEIKGKYLCRPHDCPHPEGIWVQLQEEPDLAVFINYGDLYLWERLEVTTK